MPPSCTSNLHYPQIDFQPCLNMSINILVIIMSFTSKKKPQNPKPFSESQIKLLKTWSLKKKKTLKTKFLRREKKHVIWYKMLILPCKNVNSYLLQFWSRVWNHFRISMLIPAALFTGEKEKVAVMIKFLSRPCRRKEMQTEVFQG